MTEESKASNLDISDKQKEVVQELKQSMQHLNTALSLSVEGVKENEQDKQMYLDIWEEFMKSFVKKVKTESKEANVNLMSQIPLKRFLGF